MTYIETPALNPRTVPTERSMPPAVSTKVMPTASSMMNADWTITFRMLSIDQNAGSRSEKTSTATIRARPIATPSAANACPR